MSTFWRRLLLAALISASGFALTFIWYSKTGKTRESTNINEEPIAFVGSVVDEIHRRPVTRVLWQQVSTGDALFPGEAIKTSEKGEVRIQFSDSERFLDLEPDSLIVIQKSKGEISLDLMEGSLFVNAGAGKEDAKAPQLTLKSASGKVDLSRATVSLSGSSKGKLDLQVLKGKATVESEKGGVKEIETGSASAIGEGGVAVKQSNIEILYPVLSKPVYINPEGSKQVQFKWKGVPQNAKIDLQIGSSRKNIKSSGIEIRGDQHLMPLAMGRYFWKLVAIDNITQKIVAESSVNRLEVLPRYAPAVVFPEAGSFVKVDRTNPELNLKWNLSDQLTSVGIEVAKDDLLKEKILATNVQLNTSYKLTQLKPGVYYWRLVGFFEKDSPPIPGKILKFVIGEKEVEKPVLKITWNGDQKSPQYFLDKPQANLSWNVDQLKFVKTWNLKIVPEGESLDTVEPIALNSMSHVVSVKKPGRYLASVEALDENKDIIGSSSKKSFEILPLPKISAPKLLPVEGDLKATLDGHFNANWTPVDGAKEYWITIQYKDGTEFKRIKLINTAAQFTDLMPGEYKISVLAIDKHNRESEKLTARTLIVPNTSNIVAPKLKKIRVN